MLANLLLILLTYSITKNNIFYSQSRDSGDTAAGIKKYQYYRYCDNKLII